MMRKPGLAAVLGSMMVLLYSPAMAKCGGEGQGVCKWEKASYHRKSGCHGGSFDGLNGNCYKCPKGYHHQGIFTIHDKHVCKKDAHRSYKKKKGHSCYTTGGFGPHNGKCYKCPGGYHHDSSKGFNSHEICYKDHGPHYSQAKYHNKFHCTGSEFFDPRKGGECWSCPHGTSRTAFAVTDDRACHREHGCKKGLKDYGGKCGSNCHKAHDCGGKGQKACKVWECVPSCASNHLYENAKNGRCESLPPGTTPFSATMNSVADVLTGSTHDCVKQGREMLHGTPALRTHKGHLNATVVFQDAGKCAYNFDLGFFCEAPDYIGTYFRAIAAGADATKDMVHDVKHAYENKPCRDLLLPSERGMCAMVMGISAGSRRTVDCLSHVIHDAFSSSKGVNLSHDKEAQMEKACSMLGALTFDFTADALVAEAAAGTSEEAEAAERAKKIVKWALRVRSILNQAEQIKNDYRHIKSCQGVLY